MPSHAYKIGATASTKTKDNFLFGDSLCFFCGSSMQGGYRLQIRLVCFALFGAPPKVPRNHTFAKLKCPSHKKRCK